VGLWLAAGAAAAHAQGESGSARTLREAVDQVEAETGGQILSAETVNSGDTRVHRIKVLTPDGVVKVVQVVAGNTRDSS